MGPRPTRVFGKDGMIWPVLGNVLGRFGSASLPVPADDLTCPVAVPTLIRGASGLTSRIGASSEKYMLLAPESTIAVSER